MPKIAIMIKSFLLFVNNFLSLEKLQKKNKNIDATVNRYKVRSTGLKDSTLSFIKIKELPQTADRKSRAIKLSLYEAFLLFSELSPS